MELSNPERAWRRSRAPRQRARWRAPRTPVAVGRALGGEGLSDFVVVLSLQASRIILATDDDHPGQALAEELARRLGKERCWRVKWPKKNDTDTCKDANEVLMFLGPQALRKVIDAKLYPIRGLFSFKDFFPEIDNYFLGIHGDELDIHTGWKSLDDLYKLIGEGGFFIITVMLLRASSQVKEHARKLLEKHIEKPFFDASASDRIKAMDQVLSKSRDLLYDCKEITVRLRAMLQSADEQRKESSPIVRTWKILIFTIMLFFSDNVLAASVVVNSTIMSAKEPEKHVFHLVTDKLNFGAMNMWFLLNPPGAANEKKLLTLFANLLHVRHIYLYYTYYLYFLFC
ncbi:unnamed protein product [Miscanthus lutarioriparius]|uniref:Toprim domain-containing protein n=1 Tax=Miscanthus lutarioriparius TaxID=422564 RepID=A0A811R9C2_9POAL|nr:unnamed protein product [Miscanthus lutarioriparius]